MKESFEGLRPWQDYLNRSGLLALVLNHVTLS